MKLIDLDQQIFVPITDEAKGGATYEIQTTVGEFLKGCCDEFTPEVVDAIPVDWLDDRANDITRAPLYRRYAQILMDEWQNEQEAR